MKLPHPLLDGKEDFFALAGREFAQQNIDRGLREFGGERDAGEVGPGSCGDSCSQRFGTIQLVTNRVTDHGRSGYAAHSREAVNLLVCAGR